MQEVTKKKDSLEYCHMRNALFRKLINLRMVPRLSSSTLDPVTCGGVEQVCLGFSTQQLNEP